MNFKEIKPEEINDPVFDTVSLDAELIKYYISINPQSLKSRNCCSINPQWKKIIQSPYFKIYSGITDSCDLFQTDFPDYLVHVLNEYFQKKSKSNYFSSFFSRNENQSQLDSISEAAAFLTDTSLILPEVLLSDQFISHLIYICENYCGFSALMSLKALSNIAENSFESSQLLLSKDLLPKAYKLAISSSDRQVKHQSMFLISSFAKFDLGAEIANSIFSFFFNSPQITIDLLNISLRAFAFLSHHHNQIFNQSVLVNKIYDFIHPECDVVNSQCFSIFTNLIHLNSEVIGFLFHLGIFQQIYDILKIGFSYYCIEFMEAILIETRNYDNIIFNQEFITLYEYFLENEKNQNKYKIMNLIVISLLNSSTDILTSIYKSSIFSFIFNLISADDLDQPFSKATIIGIGRSLTLLENESEYYNDLRQEFCEFLHEIMFINDPELSCLIAQFLQQNDLQN